jgi:serine/threonine protein kinase
MTVPEGLEGVVSPPDNLQQVLQEATAGDYEILGELGRGGMAAVFLAKDVSLARKVAIKTMLTELTARHDMVARFKREAQMAAQLSHPHIVQIHSVKQTKNIVYFVMKFIEGRDLVSIIGEQGAMDLDMTRLILQQAASALSFAHHRGVVHRDVKPANIMIDENGWAVMTDFGIAKIDDGSQLTATGAAVGTPHYMAPEQFHNKALTGAADQYALGIVAYEMLTGKKAFDGATLAEIITKHLFSPPPNLKVERPDLPENISETITRMLAKEPADRFADLDSAIAALGPPEPARVDATRGRLMSIARKQMERKPRLSVPMSPIPATRPSAPTSLIPESERTPLPSSSAPTPRVTPAIPAPTPRAATVAEFEPRKRKSALPWVVAATVLIVLAVPGYIFGKRFMDERARPENNASMKRGIQLWQQRRPADAASEFTIAAAELPKSALPHIYLSRLARERGDLPRATQEAVTAARLEPNNALALREMGAVFLARGDNVRARNFFLRSLRVNPSDRQAMGWLSCALMRAGDVQQAQRWSSRAGSGPWNACRPGAPAVVDTSALTVPPEP